MINGALAERYLTLKETKTETATTEPRSDTAGFVLAGGESRRMGEDKALVPFAGRTLVEQAIQILRDAGLAVWIAGARLPLERFAPVV